MRPSNSLNFYCSSCSSSFVNRRDDCHVSASHLARHWRFAPRQNTLREIINLSRLLINPRKVERAFACLAHSSVVTKGTPAHLEPAFTSFRSKVVSLSIKARRSFARCAIRKVQRELQCLFSFIEEVRPLFWLFMSGDRDRIGIGCLNRG